MSNRLPVLADAANLAHEASVIALRSAAEGARESGTYLLEARTLVGHGEWMAWLKQNFTGGVRTAQRYMRIAKHWDRILGKASRVTHLTVNEAMRLLEARDELQEALSLRAETEALTVELETLAANVDTADTAGLVMIIERSQEIHDEAMEIRSRAIEATTRLVKEMHR